MLDAIDLIPDGGNVVNESNTANLESPCQLCRRWRDVRPYITSLQSEGRAVRGARIWAAPTCQTDNATTLSSPVANDRSAAAVN